jgi:hypothetical protein
MNSYFSLSSQVDNAASTAIENTTPPSNTSTQANTVVADSLVINHWDNEAFDNDDFDSDQLDEDESYSWVCAEYSNILLNVCLVHISVESNLSFPLFQIQASGLTDPDVMGSFGVNVNCATGRGSTSVNWRDWRSGNVNDFILRSGQYSTGTSSGNNINNPTRLPLSNNKPPGYRQPLARPVSQSPNLVPSLVELCARYNNFSIPISCFM